MRKTVFPKSKFFLGKPIASNSARLGHIPSLPLKSQLPLKPCSMLQPSDFGGNCDFSDFLLDFCYCLSSTLCRGQLAPCTPRRAEPARPQLPAARILQPNHKPSPPKGVDSMAAFSVSTALLDAVVLACVAQGDTYGYELTHQIQSVFSISESTLYPVLRRLQKNEYLQTYDQPYQGRNRRYYHITDAGRTALEAYCSEWQQYKQQVDQFLTKKEDV